MLICCFDPVYAKALGVDIDELLISTRLWEQAMRLRMLSKICSIKYLIVVDSVAALVPKTEIDERCQIKYGALSCRLMSKALRKLTATLIKSI